MLDRRFVGTLVLISMTGFFTGCASIVNGTSQPVSVVTKLKDSSQDVMGAQCTLTSSKGEWYVRTPGTVVIHRGYSDMIASCTHPNYSGTASFKSSTKGMAFGNIIFGGIIGAGIDIGTGSAYDYPDMLVVPMTAVIADAAAPVTSASVVPVPASAPSPVAAVMPTGSPAVPREPKVTAPARVAMSGTATALAGGQDGFQAERLARSQSCSESPAAVLIAKGPGFESYSVNCTNGDAMSIRCEFGNCRALR